MEINNILLDTDQKNFFLDFLFVFRFKTVLLKKCLLHK